VTCISDSAFRAFIRGNLKAAQGNVRQNHYLPSLPSKSVDRALAKVCVLMDILIILLHEVSIAIFAMMDLF
jgi:hypothetical protein